MLINTKTLKGYKLHSLDGEIGRVKEFYFDDQHWTVRYLVADTRLWLPGRQVLISPHALGCVSKQEKHITVNLTRQQIEESPPLDSDKPVSRQFEKEYFEYYQWPLYWSEPSMGVVFPYISQEGDLKKNVSQGEKKTGDAHLCSTHEVSGYHIQALGGEVGHVDDFIIDDETWAIRYLVVDTKNWWPGKRVLVSPLWIDEVSWRESKVLVNLPREEIKQGPEYTEWSLLTREFEIAMHRHYMRPGYWVSDPVERTPPPGGEDSTGG
jgi:PRC-barrel domain